MCATRAQVVNVAGVAISGNTFKANAGCPRSLANYAAPYYLVNVTGLVGSVLAAPAMPIEETASVSLWVDVTTVSGGYATTPPALAGALLGAQAVAGSHTRT